MPNAIDSVERIRHGIAELERQIADQKAEYNRLLPILEEHMKPPPPGVPAPAEQQHNGAATKNENSKQDWLKKRDPIAVLVMSCNRPAAVKNHIDQLLKFEAYLCYCCAQFIKCYSCKDYVPPRKNFQ